ncbi:hypothetical protein EKO27_g1906 [Xylaria grammica]|uniref:Uncharacterized protein n=1 Tax=Xylaria grammica TaxID=363999 RepID=A0A439DFL2_9PEZI|nr:hypothetical protein EKO27_g1906 [Xylaria grammica]
MSSNQPAISPHGYRQSSMYGGNGHHSPASGFTLLQRQRLCYTRMQPYTQLDKGLNEAISTWRNGVSNPPPANRTDEVGETSHPRTHPNQHTEADKPNPGLLNTRSWLDLNKRQIDNLLSLQCYAVGALMALGRYLAALNQALGYSISFTFEGDLNKIFSARVHVYHRGETNETLGVLMRFRKDLQPRFRCFLARRLLVGMGIRFPTGEFPRPFLVAESDDNPVALAGYEALRKDGRSRKCHDVIVQQWLEERRGTYLGGEKAKGEVGREVKHAMVNRDS